jgi:hypothetical protein
MQIICTRKDHIMRQPPRSAVFPLALLLLVSSPLAACGSNEPSPGTPGSAAPATSSTQVSATFVPVIDPGDGGAYSPQLDPAEFVDAIDNPFLPMPVGAHWRYEGESEGEIETVDITVTGDRKTILGISAFVVRDTVTIGGQLVEDTYDWFAQDQAGNVWYLGEEVKDYENGQVVSTAGSWEAGVDGALPGIVMPAIPVTNDVYRQEFYAGEAEDMMEIIDVGATLTVRAGAFDDVVMTRDWTPLDPGTVEEKAYARGVGKIREAKTVGGNSYAELVEYALGG